MLVAVALICGLVEIGGAVWTVRRWLILAEAGGDNALGANLRKPRHSVDRLVEHLFEILRFSHGVVL